MTALQLTLSARLVGPTQFLRRMQRDMIRLWYREVVPLFLSIVPGNNYRIQIVVLIVIIPSIIAGYLVAQSGAQVRLPTSMLRR